MFTKKQLYKLIIPLIIEQILAVTMGLVDTVMVSNAGEAAISGVSLVDTLNILLISIFSALATGGAVVSAQYLGHKEPDKSCKAAEQLLLSSASIAFIITVISLIANKQILQLIYGDIDLAVMDNAIKYFYITALSFPFLAMYNSGAALFRAMGNSKVSMIISILMNIINIVGNVILVLHMHLGVVGSAVPTLIGRMVGAIIILNLIRNKAHPIHIDNIFNFHYDWTMIKKILHIGVPNGLENGIFQIGKILVQGLIASFGTTAITANAVANTIASFETIPGASIGLAMTPVVGQCVGANDYDSAKKYTIKLMKVAYVFMITINVAILILTKPILGIYELSPETERLAIKLLTYHSICCGIIWAAAFTLPNALRAANDVKFTMFTSIGSMWLCRIVLSYVLAKGFGLGVFGVWVAMTIDWIFRAGIFIVRFIRGRWKLHVFVS